MMTLQLGDVAPYQQGEPYSCGAAALKAVMHHWGEDVDEPTLIREIGIDPTSGSTAAQVTTAAQRRGYQAQTRRFDSIDELGTYTNRNVPVILAIRSFTRPNQGHFVVATKVNSSTVEIMDPNVRGNERTLPRRELDQRWQFRDRVGVIVAPRKSKSKSAFADAAPNTKRTVALVVGGVAIATATVLGIVFARRRSQA